MNKTLIATAGITCLCTPTLCQAEVHASSETARGADEVGSAPIAAGSPSTTVSTAVQLDTDPQSGALLLCRDAATCVIGDAAVVAGLQCMLCGLAPIAIEDHRVRRQESD